MTYRSPGPVRRVRRAGTGLRRTSPGTRLSAIASLPAPDPAVTTRPVISPGLGAIARSWTRLGPTVRDVGSAAIAGGVVCGMALLERTTTPPLAVMVLSAAIGAPLALSRRFPVAAAVISVMVTLTGAEFTSWSSRLVTAVAFGSAAYHRPRRVGVLLAVSVGSVLLTLLTAASVTGPAPGSVVGRTDGGPFVFAVLVGLAPVLVGYSLRLQRERTEHLSRLHHAQADLALAEERARLTREVHDAVGHHLTAIRMQASAALHVLDDDTAISGRTLRTINESATAALGEVRTLLAAARDRPEVDAARLADVDRLAGRLASPSCRITVVREGSAVALPASIEHGGYRLVQEALTNASRHAGAGVVQVRISQDRAGVTIVVEDDGPTCPPRDEAIDDIATGHGIAGMRERVRLLGGQMRITPAVPHGWRLEAVLPIDGAQP